MGQTLTEVARALKDATHTTNSREGSTTPVKVQIIYAFNGTGKTRLSREFKSFIATNSTNEEENDDVDQSELAQKNILYYSAFTEDLFYWDNDLNNDEERKLKIHHNAFTKWVFEEQGQDQNVITNFQHYTNEKLTPHFNEEYTKTENGNEVTVKAFSEVTFSFERGNEEQEQNIKISKGEESNFIWSIFYSLLEQVIEVLNIAELDERETNQFDQLEYIFIDDPVSSLDENHLIELAVDLAKLIKSSKSEVQFIITTHNPLFYNVLHNELRDARFKKYKLEKYEDGTHQLVSQPNDSPFSYHLYLMAELEKAIDSGQLHKYHFNFLRNILEKTSTFLGYKNWGELLPQTDNGRPNPYEARVINISSHSKHAGEEVTELTDDDKRILRYLVGKINEMYRFKSHDN